MRKILLILISTFAVLSCEKVNRDPKETQFSSLVIATKAQGNTASANLDATDKEDYIDWLTMLNYNSGSPSLIRNYYLSGTENPTIGLEYSSLSSHQDLLFVGNRVTNENSTPALVVDVDGTTLKPPFPMSCKVPDAYLENATAPLKSGDTQVSSIELIRSVAAIELSVTNYDVVTGEVYEDYDMGGTTGLKDVYVRDVQVLNVPQKMHLDLYASAPTSMNYESVPSYLKFDLSNGAGRDRLIRTFNGKSDMGDGSDFTNSGRIWNYNSNGTWYWATAFKRFYLPENLADIWGNETKLKIALQLRKDKDSTNGIKYITVPIGKLTNGKRILERNTIYRVNVILREWFDPYFEIHIYRDDWQPYNSATPLVPYNHYTVDLPAFE